MHIESPSRSVVKTLSYRVLGTAMMTAIVWLLSGQWILALSVGAAEALAKMLLYYGHERLWQAVHWGKLQVEPFVLWFTGLPHSGESELADAVFAELNKRGCKVDRLDGTQMRPLFPETGFSPDEVHLHIKRAGLLASRLEKNGIIVVASFVSPYLESRRFARTLAKKFIEVHVATSLESCTQRDSEDLFGRAQRGEAQHVPGVHFSYQANPQPELRVSLDTSSLEQARDEVLTYLDKTVLVAR